MHARLKEVQDVLADFVPQDRHQAPVVRATIDKPASYAEAPSKAPTA